VAGVCYFLLSPGGLRGGGGETGFGFASTSPFTSAILAKIKIYSAYVPSVPEYNPPHGDRSSGIRFALNWCGVGGDGAGQ